MNEQNEPNLALPGIAERVLRGLERVTGRWHVTHAVTGILLVGLLLTTSVIMAIWWVESKRSEREFNADAARIQQLTQDRLDQRTIMVEQAAQWGSGRKADGAQVGGETLVLNGIVTIPQRDWTGFSLSALLAVNDSEAEALQRCLRTANVDAVTLCHSLPGQGEDGRFLIRPLKPSGTGWVLMFMEDRELLRANVPMSTWDMRAALINGMPVALPGQIKQGAGLRKGELPVNLAGQTLMLKLEGQLLPRSWSDVLLQQMGMWVAGGSGLLCTIVALHVYLMLISTRRRASAMAGEMSAALQHTQSRNQAVMDTAPDAIIMTDAQGLVQWCNQATTSIFGRTLDDMAHHPLSAVLPSLGATSLDDWFTNNGFSNRVIGYEANGQRNEGTAFPVAISASRAQVDGELIQTFIVRDTTDAKWAEQELSLRERALASSADGVLIISMTLPNQPIIYVNSAFESITGYEGHEVLGMNCRLLQRDDRDQPGLAIIRSAIKEGRGCQVVVRNYRKDGSLFYNELAISPVLNPEGKLTHYVGVQTDITDRIAAEQVLNLRTERLNAVFDLSPDGFVVLDKRGEVSIVNPAFERMTGLMAADLVGQGQAGFEAHLMQLCQSVEVDDSGIGEAAGVCEIEGGRRATRELLHLHTPGTRTLVRRVRHGGHDNETVMYFRDITHELEVDRMKTEFLSMAAHELRTPMASIFGFTELLLNRPVTEERRKDMLSTIHRQSQILINLINELLDLARIESRRGKDFKRETQSLRPIIDNTVSGLLIHGDARTVDFNLPDEPIVVDVDREKLSLALTNVLSNAYKYSPKGGSIELDMVSRHREGRSECGIRVTDHGLGMTPEQLTQVFDRFFRADTSGNIPGTGLGMTIVKEIIELHGGEVTVSSTFGEGTTVILWLPVRHVLEREATDLEPVDQQRAA
jgi:PAS domain S-box-containing protein